MEEEGESGGGGGDLEGGGFVGAVSLMRNDTRVRLFCIR
jgi:hypothetical protein